MVVWLITKGGFLFGQRATVRVGISESMLLFCKEEKGYCELRLILRQTNFKVKMEVEIEDLE